MKFLFTLFTSIFIITHAFSQTVPGGGPQGIKQFDHSIKTYSTPPAWQESIINNEVFVFATTTYTFKDIVLFSYFDESVFYLISQDGTPLDTVSLNKDEFHFFSPGKGIYRIESNNTFSVLIGDPISKSILGYFAVDESGSPLSTRLNTYMPNDPWGGEKFIVFSYNDNTEIFIKNLTDTSIVAASILNKGEHLALDNQFGKFFSVTANKPVSALSYGDQGYFVPATNGTFAGKHFYGFSGYVGRWANGIVVTAYYDSTNYQVLNSETGDTISQGTISVGEATQLGIYNDTYWEVQTDKPVTTANIPYAAWSKNYYYMARQIDESGHGIGTHFLTPVITGDYDIFSFDDDNHITVVNKANNDTVYNAILNMGEHHHLFSTKTVYEVRGTENLSIISSTNGGFGGDFVPLNFAVGLPDLSISSADISFAPDSVDRIMGDPITINAVVHNFGYETAYNVPLQFFDGDPSGGLTISSVMYADSIPAGESFLFSTDWTVPGLAEYHSVFAIVDKNSSIIESNSSNNSSFRFIVPNQDLLPPLSVVVDAPVSVKLKGDSLDFNQFDICVNLFNTGDVQATNSYSVLMLPIGLSTDQADSINFGGIVENSTVDTCWTVKIDSLPNGTVVYNGIDNQESGQDAFFYTVKVNADNAEEKWVNRMLLINRPTPTSLEEIENRLVLPESFNLKQNYPNPFNPSTTIEYNVAKTSHILLEVYDITGRKVSTLVNGQIQPGFYKSNFEASELSSGVFFIRLNINGKNFAVKRMMLIK
ncbi:MAG: T9SS C-terminal target domain-containing protein [Calditrichaeota bacterium]|nr:MAG: T9SS C-terminal target domain-containing protein [Calditrichota bacterium]MBL1205915.1 T9SS C-terminal target domain-containing protein [Calditrichota bacterium]NOG45743.1 T9SS type A sorting domain-containing protein [Calditrichota bacterium]